MVEICEPSIAPATYGIPLMGSKSLARFSNCAKEGQLMYMSLKPDVIMALQKSRTMLQALLLAQPLKSAKISNVVPDACL